MRVFRSLVVVATAMAACSSPAAMAVGGEFWFGNGCLLGCGVIRR